MIIKTCSNKDDIVLDPFSEHGTTYYVAKKIKSKIYKKMKSILIFPKEE